MIMPEMDYKREAPHLPQSMPNLGRQGHQGALSYEPGRDLLHYLREYARERPEAAALWCFGIGFVLGWKLKPW